jgi:multisubunit Na+/H+ antiporter MnhC subunit
MEYLISRGPYLLFVVLSVFGVYLMVSHRNYVKAFIGLYFFQSAAILFFIALAFRSDGSIPIVEYGESVPLHNPLPHAMMLTAIVVGVATLGRGALDPAQDPGRDRIRRGDPSGGTARLMAVLPVLLYMTPFLAALVAAALGWWVRGSARWIAIGSLALTLALAIATVARVLEVGTLNTYVSGWLPPIGIELIVDRLSALMSVVLAGVALLTVAGSVGFVRAQLPGSRDALLLVRPAGGGGVDGDRRDRRPLQPLRAPGGRLARGIRAGGGGRAGAPRAALAYLMIGSVGATLYLLGVGFLYAATGTLNMGDASGIVAGADPRLLLVGTMLVIAGLGVKMALFPLHTWMPAAYQYAPAAASSFMAPLFTKISAYALIRVLFWVEGEEVLRRVPRWRSAWPGPARSSPRRAA